MAADLALVDEVAKGAPPALRFYRWDPPALTLGRFQPEGDVDVEACAKRGVQVARRPTGGRALLHGGDVTYAVAMPRPPGSAGSVDAIYTYLAHGLTAGLARIGVRAEVARHDGDAGPACFSSLRGSDLRVGGCKLVGSAQVHRDRAVLQHGSVLLHRLDFDETDLLVFPDQAARELERAHLRDATTTLDELGTPLSPNALVTALTSGFAESLDLDLTSTSNPPPFVAAG